ncbi:MAG: hypothetical protein JWM25_235 [Thermoleophilia bacterium]|nr:hypothetical protein [Thermoleophilia bacterium]MCZ4495652.1 hypothetical protein [Thermoleophilia bacterium]
MPAAPARPRPPSRSRSSDRIDPKGGDHIALPPGNEAAIAALSDGTTKFEWLVIDNDGNVKAAQITQRGAGSDTPPAWGGLWHRHAEGKAYMTHVYPAKPLDEAFAH